MNNELRDLYQEVIIQHSRSPKNFKVLEQASGQAEGYNPLCGDKITVYLQQENDALIDISFQGCGCAISQASASLMTAAIKGKSLSETETLFQLFHQSIMTPLEQKVDETDLGKLKVLMGVREFPMRIKCATLAWHTLQNALENKNEIANTEQGEG